MLPAVDRTRIAGRAFCDPKTVWRAYRGDRIHATTRRRIVHAADELGLPHPPEPSRPRKSRAAKADDAA